MSGCVFPQPRPLSLLPPLPPPSSRQGRKLCFSLCLVSVLAWVLSLLAEMFDVAGSIPAGVGVTVEQRAAGKKRTEARGGRPSREMATRRDRTRRATNGWPSTELLSHAFRLCSRRKKLCTPTPRVTRSHFFFLSLKYLLCLRTSSLGNLSSSGNQVVSLDDRILSPLPLSLLSLQLLSPLSHEKRGGELT